MNKYTLIDNEHKVLDTCEAPNKDAAYEQFRIAEIEGNSDEDPEDVGDAFDLEFENGYLAIIAG